MSHPRWQRLVIAFAGPFMNIVLAIGLLTGVYMVRYEHPLVLDQPAVIGWCPRVRWRQRQDSKLAIGSFASMA